MADPVNEQLYILTADIVSAHVANNSVSVSDLPALIRNVHEALAALGQPAAVPEETRREPKVSVRSSVTAEAITCLVCGAKQKMLKRHLSAAHGLTPPEYRAEFRLAPDYPMVAPAYAETRSNLAKQSGLGTKGRGRGAAKPAGRGRKSGGSD